MAAFRALSPRRRANVALAFVATLVLGIVGEALILTGAVTDLSTLVTVQAVGVAVFLVLTLRRPPRVVAALLRRFAPLETRPAVESWDARNLPELLADVFYVRSPRPRFQFVRGHALAATMPRRRPHWARAPRSRRVRTRATRRGPPGSPAHLAPRHGGVPRAA